MIKKIEDWVTPFERMLQIKSREITLSQCTEIKGISKLLFKHALKADPIYVFKKNYRYFCNKWRKRMAANDGQNPYTAPSFAVVASAVLIAFDGNK